MVWVGGVCVAVAEGPLVHYACVSHPGGVARGSHQGPCRSSAHVREPARLFPTENGSPTSSRCVCVMHLCRAAEVDNEKRLFCLDGAIFFFVFDTSPPSSQSSSPSSSLSASGAFPSAANTAHS